jgi:solute carrier family 25 folate transporter 32
VTNPIWLVKTRMALQRTAPTPGIVPYKGLADALARIWREEGVRGYYKGIGPSLLLQTSHGAIQFAVYEELKQLAATTQWHWSGWRPQLQAYDGGPPGGEGSGGGAEGQGAVRQLSSLEVSLYGALSKLSAAVSTYPTQVKEGGVFRRVDSEP